MKKRMLITTIVMMLVLAVALTTSSLAWFTASQSQVTATGGTFTASAAGSAASIGVARDMNATDWLKSAAMVITRSTGLEPLVAISALDSNLNTNPDTTVTLESIADAELLNGAHMLRTGNSTQVFPLNAENPRYVRTLASQAHSVIYVKNLDPVTPVNSLKVTLKITSDTENTASPNFYIVLSKDDGSEVYRTAVISKEEGYVVFDFSSITPTEADPLLLTEVDNADNRTTGNATIANTRNETAEVDFVNLTMGASEVWAVHVYAWYEGGTLDVTTDQCTHTYNLQLNAGVEEAGA